MLAPWLELEGAEKQVRTWSEITGLDLVRLGTTAEADEIVDTAITQPLVVALAVLAFGELRRRVELPSAVIVGGHSVGELAAAAVAGVISADDAVALAAVRGAAMAQACALEPTGMAAVLGGDEPEVLARLEELGLVPANRNGAGQIVAAGPHAALDELAANPPGPAKIRKLAVAGAFHTKYMAPAEDAVRARAAEVTTHDPSLPLVSNKDGQVVTEGAEVLRRLVSQVTSPVRWDLCQATFVEKGIAGSVELPPAGVLTGLAKRAMKGTATLALKTPDQLEKVAELFDTAGADK
ncbi:[acyl-carrier-protein] S-malonyltransferase [Lentzea californiensis]|uniref:[acyl-carrier-protein] S-malonyltransferase n=2 Tax=Pseudonocardiaceae TaxID=2070 RepID=A0A1H9XK07_9PSEU|nr:[acyl-carrier-protein] S-malonyltransferase [Lentzea californiensis]RDI20309.1 [acyl-carrier-protein] S-malonyltransferase [Lentzea flaviverrucosa]SES46495.1 [acyl-carrier-protein] S-malonyltransferase [Lentzea flaviverrucosa]